MKRWLGMAVWAAVSVSALADEPFSKRLTPADAQRAGLAKLNAQELAELDALVGRLYGAAAVSRPAEVYRPAEPVAVIAAPRGEPNRVTVAPGTQVDYAATESRIMGNVSGWEGRTVFTFENGQRWQVVNAERYHAARPVVNPKVTIKPSGFGGFWLEIEGLDQRVRVRQVTAGK